MSAPCLLFYLKCNLCWISNSFPFLSLTFPLSPPGLHLVSMDAQWMLKGCSMDAQTLLHPLSPLQKAYICLRKFVTDCSFRNSLQRYYFFRISPNFLQQNDHFSSFSCICHKKAVPLQPQRFFEYAIIGNKTSHWFDRNRNG